MEIVKFSSVDYNENRYAAEIPVADTYAFFTAHRDPKDFMMRWLHLEGLDRYVCVCVCVCFLSSRLPLSLPPFSPLVFAQNKLTCGRAATQPHIQTHSSTQSFFSPFSSYLSLNLPLSFPPSPPWIQADDSSICCQVFPPSAVCGRRAQARRSAAEG